MIDTAIATPLNIVMNGVISGNTGVDAVAATNVTAGFDPASTINGCAIANPASCNAFTPTPTPIPLSGPEIEIQIPVQDVINEEVSSVEFVIISEPTRTSIIQFGEAQNRDESFLIDEAVTGVGNDDLWVGEADCETIECKNQDDERESDPVQTSDSSLEPAE